MIGGSGAGSFETIDAQLHTWSADDTTFPWDRGWTDVGDPMAGRVVERMSRRAAPYDEVVALMDDVGVAGALLASPRIYGFDNRYALEAAREHPSRFRVVGVLDHCADDIDEQVAVWASRPETAGLRVSLRAAPAVEALRLGHLDRLFAAAEEHHVPSFIYPPGVVDEVAPIAARYPSLQVIVDHFGVPQGPGVVRGDDIDLHDLLDLSRYDNVFVKASALPTLSTEPYPYNDLWPYIHRVLDAFGSDRMMWGSDYTRELDRHSYRDSVDYLRLSTELTSTERERILGQTLRRVVKW